ncbi:hypothetical protein [Kitasatospora mediocidica]|uniref:hypothetical protein n=1 Tax=Kitasatospora mediocidica TaxID=58352 RepID=UPI00056A5851|nr:hypothetical protein [Kitasatospora mediocidica]
MSTFDMLVVLPPMRPEHYREAAVAALGPYRSEREVPPYRDYEAADPNSVYWVQANKEHGLLPNREGLGWSEIADLMNAVGGKTPDHSSYLYVDDTERGYFLSTHNPQSEWDGLGLRIGGPRLLHRPSATGDPLLAKYEYGEVLQDRDLLAGLTNRCDGGPRGLLDFDALRAAHERLAGERHDAWVAGGKRPQAWPFRFTEDRTENVARAHANAVPGYALLRLDGSWTDERDDGYLQDANAYLDALDPESVVLDVSCHC